MERFEFTPMLDIEDVINNLECDEDVKNHIVSELKEKAAVIGELHERMGALERQIEAYRMTMRDMIQNSSVYI